MTNLSSCSIILTCRDEKGNIEEIIKRIPQVCVDTEIIFVEGHSTDGTYSFIQNMIYKYPEKKIKLYKQEGKGQGDAFRLGMEKANGEFLIWFECDLTIPPEVIQKFWNLYLENPNYYFNGTRFFYKIDTKTMAWQNQIGNFLFSKLLGYLFKYPYTDTLCGAKAISKNNYLKIVKSNPIYGQKDPFGDFDLLFGVFLLKLKVAEVPVQYLPRIYGVPKAYGGNVWGLFCHAIKLLKLCKQYYKIMKKKDYENTANATIH